MRNRTLLGAFLAAAFVVVGVHLLEFPGSVPNFQAESGGGTLLDAKPAFSEDAIYQRLESYGERGRRNYAFRNLTVDILLPLSVFPFLFLLMKSAIRRVASGRAIRILLLSLPLAYVVFDFAENATVLALLAYYPSRLAFAPAVLPYFTVIKRVASLLALAVPIGILIFVFVRDRRAAVAASAE